MPRATSELRKPSVAPLSDDGIEPDSKLASGMAAIGVHEVAASEPTFGESMTPEPSPGGLPLPPPQAAARIAITNVRVMSR